VNIIIFVFVYRGPRVKKSGLPLMKSYGCPQ